MRRSKGIALSGMFAALSTVIMWIGALSGLGTYASPMLAGAALIPIGILLGVKYQALCYVAVSLLSLIVSADPEENLFFIALLGWYPIVRPYIEKRGKWLGPIIKLIIFNVISVAIEILMFLVIAPEAVQTWLVVTLLALGNLTFFVYDRLLPRLEAIIFARLGKHRR